MRIYDGWEPLLDENSPQREKVLGSGGQGTVYLVRSPERAAKLLNAARDVPQLLNPSRRDLYDPSALGKSFALLGEPDPPESLGALKHFKITSDDIAEEAKAMGRLESEVKALTSLRGHPGVLRLLHANITERFIITEYHNRGTLDRHLRSYKGNVLAVLEAFRQLVDAVAKIHETSAIHRDIKPENIFVTAVNGLALGDFGIVFFQSGSERLTTTYERVGSHEWMAPWAYKKEKLEFTKINTALDIFPLAKVLWSMIAGQNGFPFWEYSRDENNLEKLFPDDPIMKLVNERVLSKRIVRDAQECDPSANSFLADVEGLIDHIKNSRGYKQKRTGAWPCRACGIGSYKNGGHKVRGFREGGPLDRQNLDLYIHVCDHCGHAELFAG